MNTPQQPTSTQELFDLCYNILDTACPENVTQDMGLYTLDYNIVDPSDNTIILSAHRTRMQGFHTEYVEYVIGLYEQRLPLNQEDAKRLYHTISAVCSAIINEKLKAESQKCKEEKDKRLQANIAKAKEYLKHATSSPIKN